MKRLTHEADFGLEDWEETLFSVPSDPNGAYNIIDIAKHHGDPEFDDVLKKIALRLCEIENVIGDDYDLDRLRDLVEADRIVGQKLWLTKWFTHGVRIANPPIPRNVIFFSRLKNGEILLHLKDGAFPPRLIGDCAYKTYEEAKAALKGKKDG